MKLPKRVIYALFGFIIFLNIIIRYPFIPHEAGSDSFMMHSYANSISGFGYATWIIHPYSFLGLTPDSYPSAVPFFLSALSQTTNLDMELTILIFSIFIGLLGVFGAYLLAKQIKNDDLFILTVVILFSTAPVFLRFSFWTASTRNLFLGLFPFFLWSLFKIQNSIEINWKYIGLAITLLILLLSIHRMGLLLFFVLFAFITNILIFRYSKKFEFHLFIPKVAAIIWFVLIFTFIGMQIMNFGIYEEINTIHDYQTGQIFRGNNYYSILLNMVVDYTSRIGILSFFGIIGFGVIFIKRKKTNTKAKIKRNFFEIFIILILLLSSTIILLGVYSTLFSLIFFILLIGIGIIWVIKKINRIKWGVVVKHRSLIISGFIIFLLIISTAFTVFMMNHWYKPISSTQESKWVEDETIDSVFYSNIYRDEEIYLTNSELLRRRIEAWHKDPINYQLDLESVTLEKGGILDLITHETLYIKRGGTEDQVLKLPGKTCDEIGVINYLDRNNVVFIIEENTISGQFVGASRIYDSPFLHSLPEKRYKIYKNELETIWQV